MKRSRQIAWLAAALVLGSCAPAPAAPTPDIALIQTSAAQTVMANFTLTAAAFTPTPLAAVTDTPMPLETSSAPAVTNTPTLLPGGVTATPAICDALIFDPATVDVNVPDNTEMQIGQDFVKTWRVKNNGTCTWGAGYKLMFSYGDLMSGQPQPFTGVVVPGQEVELSVNFKAPTKAGVYLSAWQLANAAGKTFPKPIYVKIIVK
jgi:Ig-like domain-containing protein